MSPEESNDLRAALERLEDVERRASALELSLATIRETSSDSPTRGIVSVPGSAWDIIVQDRDRWKTLAVKAQEDVTRLTRERDSANFQADNLANVLASVHEERKAGR